jgi:hypothetical protein
MFQARLFKPRHQACRRTKLVVIFQTHSGYAPGRHQAKSQMLDFLDCLVIGGMEASTTAAESLPALCDIDPFYQEHMVPDGLPCDTAGVQGLLEGGPDPGKVADEPGAWHASQGSDYGGVGQAPGPPPTLPRVIASFARNTQRLTCALDWLDFCDDFGAEMPEMGLPVITETSFMDIMIGAGTTEDDACLVRSAWG